MTDVTHSSQPGLTPDLPVWPPLSPPPSAVQPRSGNLRGLCPQLPKSSDRRARVTGLKGPQSSTSSSFKGNPGSSAKTGPRPRHLYLVPAVVPLCMNLYPGDTGPEADWSARKNVGKRGGGIRGSLCVRARVGCGIAKPSHTCSARMA